MKNTNSIWIVVEMSRRFWTNLTNSIKNRIILHLHGYLTLFRSLRTIRINFLFKVIHKIISISIFYLLGTFFGNCFALKVLVRTESGTNRSICFYYIPFFGRFIERFALWPFVFQQRKVQIEKSSRNWSDCDKKMKRKKKNTKANLQSPIKCRSISLDRHQPCKSKSHRLRCTVR